MEKINKLALELFTVVIVMGIISYAVYMIIAKIKKLKVDTPDDRTYRLAFCVVIVVAISFLSFGCNGGIDKNVLAIFGTIAGYVLGGVNLSSSDGRNSTDNKEPQN